MRQLIEASFVPESNSRPNMLRAPAKHGLSLGEYREAAQKAQSRLSWVDRYYHEVMLAAMLLELLLLGALVAIEVWRIAS